MSLYRLYITPSAGNELTREGAPTHPTCALISILIFKIGNIPPMILGNIAPTKNGNIAPIKKERTKKTGT